MGEGGGSSATRANFIPKELRGYFECPFLCLTGAAKESSPPPSPLNGRRAIRLSRVDRQRLPETGRLRRA